MIIAAAKIKLHMSWVHSLKEKRMVVKSICAKISNRFHVSVAEIEEQDIHQIAVIGIAAIAGDHAQADSILDHIIQFTEENTEAVITDIEREIIT
jgi:uncharacterized protein YlxP (DUF503 family)